VIKISIDAMGGDFGPEVVIPGAAKALERHPDIRFIFFGLPAQVEPVLARYPKLKAASEFRASEVAISMDDKPSQALRAGRGKSSMWQAIEAVKTGDADACISAGNTGALMAMSKFCLRMMSDVERPAIAGIWPTLRGESIVLDIGATIGADARQLVDYAVMGAGMARALFEVRKPTVGLLNVGTEEVKGLDEIKEAGQILRDTPLEGLAYSGFVEGNDIGKGSVDVVVTEGLTGNSARCSPRSAMFSPKVRSTACAKRWTRTRSMAAFSWVSVELSSKVMAARMRKASALRSKSAMTW